MRDGRPVPLDPEQPCGAAEVPGHFWSAAAVQIRAISTLKDIRLRRAKIAESA
jgi:hypothetical protein